MCCIVATPRGNGVGLYVNAGKLVLLYNYLNLNRTRIAASETLEPGEYTILATFDYQGDGVGQPADITLLVDGHEVASGRVEKTIPLRISLDETMDIGEDTGTPISEDYEVPFTFTGMIEKVTVTLK